MSAPIRLYYWPTPNGWKITIMLEELGVPYDVEYVNILKGDQFGEDFLKISPNNRMPAIVDPDGPGGAPISIFESGAILQYLGRKFGRFYPRDERPRVEVEQWLFWQVGGLGPMAGQAHHFLRYAPEKIPYAAERYVRECRRLYGVMERRLADRDFLAGDYSIADMAAFGWAVSHEWHDVSFDAFPKVKAWFERVGAREAVKRGLAVGAEERDKTRAIADDEEARRHLFGIDSRREKAAPGD
ncbi:glutathione S-transferase family protein [Amphiplicatus metriothermophilus]|uniref:GST-like protein n=1 Tax=Amphiplicatus metriothermophilus TaxID=1519374 RepID=A0A239PUK6_9PROT|nr:glutathione S-transferase N-terminal domain-containing protein [Amphiplicatus metriothermophilus]MBB5519433.1 GST-like protein [Amphiplicatus metriothermophilus]SNT73612.1 GST-like protein [Amphiplicatus metriothermophilus]